MAKKKKKKGRGHAKGSSFERKICKALSLWWTNEDRDDVFWRTSGSGARAKTRSKTSQKTFGQYGDVQATDPIGQPLIDLISLELKRGYGHTSVADVLDKTEKSSIQEWEKWVMQAREDSENAGVFAWMIICQRNRKCPIVFMPFRLLRHLESEGVNCLLNRARPQILLKMKRGTKVRGGKIFGTTLSEFLRLVSREDIERAASYAD